MWKRNIKKGWKKTEQDTSRGHLGCPQKALVWDTRGPSPHSQLLPVTLGEERLGIPPAPHSTSEEGTDPAGAKGSRCTGDQAWIAQPCWRQESGVPQPSHWAPGLEGVPAVLLSSLGLRG